MTIASVVDAAKRYSGYARFIGPLWARYVSLIAAHPKAAAYASIILVLLILR